MAQQVAILGRGTSALLTGLVCLRNGHDIEFLYDPDTPILDVGESAAPDIGSIIYAVLGKSVQEMATDGIVSIKAGAKFVNWGKGKTFHHSIGAQIRPQEDSQICNQIGFHFETKKFNEYIIDLLKKKYWGGRRIHCGFTEYKVHDKSITYTGDGKSVGIGDDPTHKYNFYDFYDFVIDCRGWHDTKEGEYLKPNLRLPNSAVLYRENSVDHDFDYTLQTATEDAWEFGLPFPKSKSGPYTKKGYLFNKDISDVDSIKAKIESKDNVTDVRVKEWTPKISQKLIQDKFMAYNGNRLFFLDPLGALSLQYYTHFAQYICDFITSGHHKRTVQNAANVNNQYFNDMMEYQDLLSFHYQHGSSYNTPFWENIIKDSRKQITTLPNGHIDNFLHNLHIDLETKSTSWSTIGAFESSDMLQIYCGMNDITRDEILKDYVPLRNKYDYLEGTGGNDPYGD